MGGCLGTARSGSRVPVENLSSAPPQEHQRRAVVGLGNTHHEPNRVSPSNEMRGSVTRGVGSNPPPDVNVSAPNTPQRLLSTEPPIEASDEGVAPAVYTPLSGNTTPKETTWMERLGSKMRSFGTWIKKNPLVAVSGAIGLAWGAVAFTFALPVVAIVLTVTLPILCGGGAYVYHWLDRDDS
ncbi:hypothetical protein SK355_00680 [Candidatus Fukatsuia symbiotica]|uniref:Uncharacterized protein n=1 Tax=Candidatus Fukatsuia symbiotica TaxID=1878942 RepID=A0A2U8I7D0_9GAMM|nr:hypothetical protein [Candidatus Fukatsuia symbiotica]AWK15070.1 hypothetical protein CCS41_12260 [Candidatus Fukatsuia symbiotica]MEA9443877.1 hypothetical protein [Candidatus Fukatsuia symbiotica]